jgi:predicted nucleic acid-binding protein
MTEGLIDTNVFLRAITRDTHADEYRAFLALIEQGQIQVQIDPLVIHELSYTLPRLRQHRTRDEVAAFLLTLLTWPGIIGDKVLLVDAIQRWQAVDGLGFVDAFLTARAIRERWAIYTKNIRHFTNQGIEIPDPLPSMPESPSTPDEP